MEFIHQLIADESFYESRSAEQPDILARLIFNERYFFVDIPIDGLCLAFRNFYCF